MRQPEKRTRSRSPADDASAPPRTGGPAIGGKARIANLVRELLALVCLGSISGAGCVLVRSGLPGMEYSDAGLDGDTVEALDAARAEAAVIRDAADDAAVVILGAVGAACRAGSECQSGFCATGRCCNGACTGPCESCGRPGQAGTCGSIPFESDVDNCGACVSRCSTNHIRATCTSGSCFGECEGGFADCNGSKRADGCETAVADNPQNCGGCAVRCPGTRCLAGSCEKIEFEFSFVGTVAGNTCISVDEPSDPNLWSDNYLCTRRDFGLRWSIAGEIPGMVCTQIVEPSDPHAWSDNYLCAPFDYGLRWSFVGPIPGMRCTLFNEPSDPHAWSDNYLCAPP